MQAISDAARAVLLADTVEVSAGCDLLNDALEVTADLSDHLQGGTVERTMGAPIHGTCKLQLATALAWGLDLVRPYMELTAGGVTVRFNTGVFCLTTPDSPIGEDQAVYDVQGYDRLYLLDRPVGDTYYVDEGDSYLDAVQLAIDAAGLTGVDIDQAAAAKTLPTAKVWPLLDGGTPTTWLRIVNDLLGAINYRGIWADENGLFRSGPYVLPSARAGEFTITTDATTILDEERTLIQDVWRIPNRWVFVQSNRNASLPAPSEGAGIWTYDLPDAHPLSAASRNLTWPDVREIDAADQASLEARGAAAVAADLRVTSTLKVATGPFPAAGHADVLSLDDPDLGPVEKVIATRWALDLLGGNTSWDWEIV